MIMIRRFLHYPLFLQLITLLCVIGAVANGCLLGKDLLNQGILWRLHAGFFILYAAQFVFILVEEKWVFFLMALQGVLALCTTADFIFVPLLQLGGRIYFTLCSPTVEAQKVYQYVFMSAAFTLQMAAAAYVWLFFKQNPTSSSPR